MIFVILVECSFRLSLSYVPIAIAIAISPVHLNVKLCRIPNMDAMDVSGYLCMCAERGYTISKHHSLHCLERHHLFCHRRIRFQRSEREKLNWSVRACVCVWCVTMLHSVFSPIQSVVGLVACATVCIFWQNKF